MTNLSGNNNLIEKSDLPLLARQIQKDFMMFGVEFEVDSIASVSMLEEVLSREVRILLETSRPKMAQVIYRIDVPEQAVSKALNTTDLNEMSASITALIIKRTLQKLEIRKRHL